MIAMGKSAAIALLYVTTFTPRSCARRSAGMDACEPSGETTIASTFCARKVSTSDASLSSAPPAFWTLRSALWDAAASRIPCSFMRKNWSCCIRITPMTGPFPPTGDEAPPPLPRPSPPPLQAAASRRPHSDRTAPARVASALIVGPPRPPSMKEPARQGQDAAGRACGRGGPGRGETPWAFRGPAPRVWESAPTCSILWTRRKPMRPRPTALLAASLILSLAPAVQAGKKATGEAAASAETKSAEGGANAAAGGRMTIEKPIVDVGESVRGQPASAVLEIKDTGPGVVKILSAKPGCGCTVASFDEAIPPGKAGKVTAQLHTESYRGPVEKEIVVTSDDPENRTMALRLKATIVGSVEI